MGPMRSLTLTAVRFGVAVTLVLSAVVCSGFQLMALAQGRPNVCGIGLCALTFAVAGASIFAGIRDVGRPKPLLEPPTEVEWDEDEVQEQREQRVQREQREQQATRPAGSLPRFGDKPLCSKCQAELTSREVKAGICRACKDAEPGASPTPG